MSRRSLGSIQEVGKNRWLIQASVGYQRNGKRQRVTKRVTGTREAAERELARILVQAPLTKAPGNLTVEDYLLTMWLPSKTHLEASTQDGYLQKVRTHISPHLGRVALKDLSPQHIQRWLREMGAAPATQLHAYRVLRNAMNQAVKWELVSRNPLLMVDAPRVEPPEISRPSLPEALQIIDLFKGHSVEPAIALALGAGLRRSECCALLWSDIDLKKGTVSVARKRVRLGGQDVVSSPKSTRSRRKLTIAAWAVDVLKSVRRRQLENRLAAGVLWFDSDHVVVGRHGHPLAPNSITHAITDIRAQAEMRGITFHGLRHGFATLSVLAGVDLPTLSSRMGHSNVKITQAYYEILEEGDRAAADKLDRLFKGGQLEADAK